MNEDEAARLLERLADDKPINPAPVTRLIEGGRRMRRRQRLLSVGSVAAVAALIIGAGVLWLPGTNGSTRVVGETNTPDGSALPDAPDGTRWVGFNGVMVAVPESWSVNDTLCWAPLSDTVGFEASMVGDCPDPGVLGISALRPLALSSAMGRQYAETEGETVDLDGTTAIRAGGGCDESSPPQCSDVLTIRSMDAVLLSTGPDPNVISAILDSARLIPDGYTAVPDTFGMVDDSDVSAVMGDAGLEWTPQCPPDSACRLVPIAATDPAAGSVVPVGTTVKAIQQCDLTAYGGFKNSAYDKEPPSQVSKRAEAVLGARFVDLALAECEAHYVIGVLHLQPSELQALHEDIERTAPVELVSRDVAAADVETVKRRVSGVLADSPSGTHATMLSSSPGDGQVLVGASDTTGVWEIAQAIETGLPALRVSESATAIMLRTLDGNVEIEVSVVNMVEQSD